MVFETKQYIARLNTSELIFHSLILLTVIEQVFYLFTGSYIYRYGVSVKKMPIIDQNIIQRLTTKPLEQSNLSVKTNEKKKEIYLRYRYPFGVWGPLLFVGQIKMRKPNTMQVRVGIFTGILALFLLFSPVFVSDYSLYHFLNSMIFLVIITFFLIRFQRLISI